MKKIINILAVILLLCATNVASYYIGGHDINILPNHKIVSTSYADAEYEAEEDAYYFYHILDQVYVANPEIFDNVICEAPAYSILFKERFPYAKHWYEIQNAMHELDELH